MESNNDYQVYSDNEPKDDNRFSPSRLCSCLYLYTIGSCRYFDASLSRKDRIELRMLRESQNARQNGSIDTDTREDQWKKKARKADYQMRKRIRYHFKDHIKKWRDPERPRFPWKMILYFILVIVVSVQVILYGFSIRTLTDFMIEKTKLYNKIFVSKEKLYTLDQVHMEINNIVDAYYAIRKQSASFLYYIENGSPTLNATKLTMSVEFINLDKCDKEKIKEFPSEVMDVFATKASSAPIHRDLYPMNKNTTTNSSMCNNISTSCCSIDYCNFSIKDQIKPFINGNNLFNIKRIKFNFTLGAFYHANIIERDNAIDAKFDMEIYLINELLKGYYHVAANIVETLTRFCQGGMRNHTILDIIVFILLVSTSIPYIISVCKTIRLARDVKLHFLAYHRKKLSWKQISLLYNKWYILVLFTCLLLMVTTALKVVSEYIESVLIHLIESVTVLFGFGIFLLWCGLLGFLQYFESLNVLLITLKLALPSFLRFAVCVLILLIAFTLCGWVVIGSYNSGFDNPIKALENLIGLLNGDEIINTFQSFDNDSVAIGVQLFSKIYLVLFIFVFIYVILSLFIGIFDHAYDSLSDKWKERSHGFLWDWAYGEKDNDLTKSYPFPVPRIRKLSNKFTMPSSVNYLSVEDEDFMAASLMHNNTEVPLIHHQSVTSQEPMSDDGNTNDLESSHQPKKQNGTYYPNHLKNDERVNSKTLPAYTSLRPHLRFRCFTDVKSIVAEPPDANQDDVYKARIKIQSRDQLQALQIASEESNV